MQAGVVGPSSQQTSLPFNAERTVNMHVVTDKDGKNPSSLYSRPGNNLFGTQGTGPGRGGLLCGNGRAFGVSGATVFEIFSDGTTTSRGSLDGSSGDITLAENGFQLAVCDGTSLYILTFATNVFAKVINANLPSAATVTFLDGYFIVNKSFSSGIFQISSPYDGTAWAALDFATAESSPDSLYRVIAVLGQLWLVGAISTEIWSDTGAANFPFQRVNTSAILSVGTIAPYSVADLDNTIFWVGQNKSGFGIVYRADGYSPQRVSTEAVELKLQQAPSPSTLKGLTFQENGHTYYIITGGGMETAQVLDLLTNIWTEWAYLNDNGDYELPITSFLLFAFSKTIAFDRRNGNLYLQSLSYFTDNGAEIARDRIFTHIFNESLYFRIKNLVINFEVGLANADVEDPQMILYLSQDGGKTWFQSYTESLGEIGQFLDRIIFWQLGQYRQCTFRLRVTDAIRIAITGGEFNV